MQSAHDLSATHEIALQTRADIWELAEICLQQTADALHEVRAGTPAEISKGISLAREDHIEKKPSDLIEVLARIQGHAEEHLGPAILEMSDKVASTLTPYPPLIPFAGKLITPTAFYDSFESIYEIARILRSPAVYTEDTDSIGIASINPVASLILAQEIREAAFKRLGIRPFITIARLDYESWTFLIRKHFAS
ncbi:MAG: hypothetical protein WCL19_00325 [Verrucomicrobiota bacterium]